MQLTDAQLIEEHRRGSRGAFAELAGRHVDWVYSCAKRRLRDEHLAQDATQAAFEVLARKAPRLREGEVLSLWLHGVVVLTCKQLLRSELRRRRRETEAAKMRGEIDMPEENPWTELSPHLDEMVGRLNREDRQAVLLRFFEQKSFAEIGSALGVSEEAARKRVSRAIDKMRAMLAGKAANIPAATLAATLLAETTRPAPAALAANLSAGSAASGALVKGVIAIMVLSKMKIALLGFAALLLLGGGSLAVKSWLLRGPSPSHLVAKSPATAPSAPPSTAQVQAEEFSRVYRLADSENLKNVPPPFLPGRFEAFWAQPPQPGRPIDDRMVFTWDGALHRQSAADARTNPLSDIIVYSLDIAPYDINLRPDIAAMELPGDWIIRASITEQQKLDGLAQIVQDKYGRKMRFESQPTEQEVIVVAGTFRFVPLPQSPSNYIHFFADDLDREEGAIRSDPFARWLLRIGSEMNLRFVDRTTGDPPNRVRWTHHQSAMNATGEPLSPEREQKLRHIISALGQQTSLTFTRAIQTCDVWHAVEQ